MFGKAATVRLYPFGNRTRSRVRRAVGAVAIAVMICALLPVSSAQSYSYTCSEDKTLTYAFGNLLNPKYPGPGGITAVEAGMNAWAQVANLEFVPGTISEDNDIDITWYSGNHFDELPFDGPGGIRAHSFSPCKGGSIHFDADETWSVTAGVPFGQPVFLQSFTTHESGHAIGLGDSTDPASVMYEPEMYQSVWMHTKLGWDDIAGVQWIYGRANGVYHLRNSNSTGSPNSSFLFNNLGDRPVAGDWNGDGDDTIGIWRPSNGNYVLREGNPFGEQTKFQYGKSGDRPVVGDWDGNGTTTAGIYRPSNTSFYLDNTNTSSSSEYFFAYGTSEDLPVSGDWDGNGTETVGVFRPSNGTFHLRNSNSAGPAALIFAFGAKGDQPVVGDWNSDGIDTVGVYRPSTGMFYIRNSNSAGVPDLEIAYGRSNLGVVVSSGLPVAADWDNNGTETIGLYQN